MKKVHVQSYQKLRRRRIDWQELSNRRRKIKQPEKCSPSHRVMGMKVYDHLIETACLLNSMEETNPETFKEPMQGGERGLLRILETELRDVARLKAKTSGTD